MAMQPRRTGLMWCSALPLVAALIWWSGVRAAPGAPLATNASVAPATGATTPDPAVAHDRLPGVPRVRVLDAASGAPIAGARLLASCSGRSLAGPTLARSDRAGMLEVRTREPAWIAASGYVAARCEPPAEPVTPGGEPEVSLQRGAGLAVRCEYEDGSPAPGVAIGLTQTAVPARMPCAAAAFAPRPDRAGLATAVTDAAGTAEFTGLHSGDWWYAVDAPGALLEEQQQEGVRLDAPGRRCVVLRLRRLTGFRAQVVGGRPQAVRLVDEACRFAAAEGNLQAVVRATWRLQQERTADCVQDAWLTGPGAPPPGTDVAIELLLAERGWVRERVRCELWRDLATQVIDVSVATRAVPGQWFTWQGDALGPVRVVLDDSTFLMVASGERTWLPAGDHLLQDLHGNPCEPGLVTIGGAGAQDLVGLGYGSRRALVLDVAAADGTEPLWAQAWLRCKATPQVGTEVVVPVWYGRACRLLPADVTCVEVRACLPGGPETTAAVDLVGPVTFASLRLSYP